jgi:2'-5' RNA ligase
MDSSSALILSVPEAEPLVNAYRDQFDPVAQSIPAHFTVLYPFVPPERLDAGVLDQLATFFKGCEPFDFALTALRRFPEVLYLAPDPEAPIRSLTERLQVLFPDYPNYGGAFATIIPHVTVARAVDPQRLAEIEQDFQTRFGAQLPLRARAREVALIENTSGQWEAQARFGLGEELSNS